ncbi:MAG: VPLPA-CTERM sorting domain-containing protein [Parvularcula sp.]
MKMTRYWIVCTIATISLLATPANAALLTITFDNLQFTTLGEVTGTIDFDTDTQAFSNANIVAGADHLRGESVFTVVAPPIPGVFDLLVFDGPPSLNQLGLGFVFASLPTETSTTLLITGVREEFCSFHFCGGNLSRLGLFGSASVAPATVAPIPLPAAALFMGAGLVGLAGTRRAKRKLV